jgi:hypothetical protein
MKRATWMLAALALLLGGVGQAKAGFLTTTYAGGNAQSGNMFDVTVAGNNLTVTGFDLNLASGTWTIQVYEKSGSWVGFSNNAAAWTLVDSITGVVSSGEGSPTFVDVADFGLQANSASALYITTTSQGGIMQYTNGTGVGNVAASNADLLIREGAGIEYAFGTTYTPRIWNGTIYYEQSTQPTAVPEPSGLALLGIAAATLAGYSRWKRVSVRRIASLTPVV